MKNNMNKKVMIAIFFSLIMLAGGFAVMGNNSGAGLPQSVPQSMSYNVTSPDLFNISSENVGNLTHFTNVTLSNNGTNVGYAHIYEYVAGDNCIHLSTLTFKNTTGHTFTFANTSDFFSLSKTYHVYNATATSNSGLVGILGMLYPNGGNLSAINFYNSTSTIILNLSSPVNVVVWLSLPYTQYSDEQIIYNNSAGGFTHASYNPYYNLIYLASPCNGALYILNGSTYAYVDNVTTNMSNVFSALYNPYNHYEYVAGTLMGISIFNGTTALASGLNSSVNPIALAYDPVNHYVYVASNNGYGLWIYNGTKYAGNISYDSGSGDYSPYSVIYDNANGMIYSSYYNSSTDYGIVEINPNTESIVKFIPTTYVLNGLAYNPENNEIYGTSGAYTYRYARSVSTTSISVYNPSNFTVEKTLVTPKMPQMGMMVLHGYLYIEANDSTLYVYSQNNTLVYEYTNLNPYNLLMGITYDNNTDKIILSAMGVNGNGAPEPSKLIALTPFNDLDVKEYGLPENTSWSYEINNMAFNVTGNTYNVYILPGAYNISVPGLSYMYPVYSPYVNVNGTLTEIIHFELKGLKSFNNTMVIGYYLNNSLSTGNFTFKNYSFHEQILNSTAIFISTNSTHAPNVTLSFKVSNGVYDVLMTNATGNTSIINQTSPVNGYINVTYNPAKMPLDPTFSVSPVTCVVAPAPPPLPPGGPVQVISHPFKYFDYSIWTILMWAAIAAAVVAALYIVFRRH